MDDLDRLHSGNVDDEARAEMLAYLVVAQLTAHARCGKWLSSEHALESADIWCGSNGAICRREEKVFLAHRSAELAASFLPIPKMLDIDELRGLFTEGWRLDYRNVLVRAIFDVCADHLVRCEQRRI
jgi:hypothetical protein